MQLSAKKIPVLQLPIARVVLGSQT